MGAIRKSLTVLACAGLLAAARLSPAQEVAARVPVVLPGAPVLGMRVDLHVTAPAAGTAALPQLSAPSIHIEDGEGKVLWRDVPVQLGLALPDQYLGETTLPVSALTDPANGSFQSAVFGQLVERRPSLIRGGASVDFPEKSLGRGVNEADENGFPRLLERLAAAGTPSSGKAEETFDGSSARLTRLGFAPREVAEARARLARLGEVLADPSVPAPVRGLLLHNSILATSLAGKPVTEIPLPTEPEALALFRSPEGAASLRAALARVSPGLDAVLTPHEVMMFDREAVVATAGAESTRRAGLDFSALLALKDDHAAFRAALDAIYASVSGVKQGLLFGYPLSAVTEFAHLRGAPKPYHTVDIHGGAGIGEVAWSTIDPLHPDSMSKMLWYAGVLDHVAEYIRGRLNALTPRR